MSAFYVNCHPLSLRLPYKEKREKKLQWNIFGFWWWCSILNFFRTVCFSYYYFFLYFFSSSSLEIMKEKKQRVNWKTRETRKIFQFFNYEFCVLRLCLLSRYLWYFDFVLIIGAKLIFGKIRLFLRKEAISRISFVFTACITELRVLISIRNVLKQCWFRAYSFIKHMFRSQRFEQDKLSSAYTIWN